MGKQLRSELSNVKADLSQARHDLSITGVNARKDRQIEFEEREKGVSTMRSETSRYIQGLREERENKSTQLRSDLLVMRAELSKLAAEDRKARQKDVSRIRAEARDLLENYRKDSAEAAVAWREVAAAIRGKGDVAVADTPAKAKATGDGKAQKAAEEKSPLDVLMEEEMPAEGVVPEERERLENRILELVRGNPEGIKLSALVDAVGEAKATVNSIARMLVEEGKLRKDSGLFLPG